VDQQDKKNIILIGYSGHAYVIADSLNNSNKKIIGYTDTKISKNNPCNLKYLGYEKSDDFKFLNNKFSFFVAVGNNNLRYSISQFMRSKRQTIINVIDNKSVISKDLILGTGIFIAKNVSINSFCKIENDVIINTSAVIDHECIVESGSHIAPGAVLLGNVSVGKKSFIGANSVVKEGVKIGDNVIVGAGSVVLKDVSDNSIIYGNPAKLKS
tara:strand:- start:812 stop:1447 length:636 start_codon:yes stop_codon:yes gene_type:complete